MNKDKWLTQDNGGRWFNVQIPDETVSDPKSFYNSKEGIEYREWSNKKYEELTKNN